MNATCRTIVSLAGLVVAGHLLAAPVRIGVVLKGQTAFWQDLQKGVEAAAAKAGAEVTVKTPPTEDSAALQIRQVQALGAMSLDALIIAADDKGALAPAVSALAAKGVKVVAVDSPLDSREVRCFVGTDHAAAGTSAGKVLAGAVSGGGRVAIFRASEIQTGGATDERESAAIASVRAAQPAVAIHAEFRAGGDPDIALQRAEKLLEKYPQLQGVLASSTTGSVAMLHALRSSRRAGAVRFVGFGFNLPQEIHQAIADGTVTAWVAQLPRAVGAKAVEVSLALVEGRTVAPVVYEDFLVITKENLESPQVKALVTP